MKSTAPTVEAYLAELGPDRRAAIATVRETILAHLPPGYEEVMDWGKITYQVPLSVFPHTYNGQPLIYAALASQKNHMAVYLTVIYASEEARSAFEAGIELSQPWWGIQRGLGAKLPSFGTSCPGDTGTVK